MMMENKKIQKLKNQQGRRRLCVASLVYADWSIDAFRLLNRQCSRSDDGLTFALSKLLSIQKPQQQQCW